MRGPAFSPAPLVEPRTSKDVAMRRMTIWGLAGALALAATGYASGSPHASSAARAACTAAPGGVTIPGDDPADDIFFGTDHRDVMRGGDGNDEIHGEGGGDCLYGQDGKEAVFGEDGGDRLDGGRGGVFFLRVETAVKERRPPGSKRGSTTRLWPAEISESP